MEITFETEMAFHEHIYENVTNRYKYKIFNGIINSFTSKARDLSMLKRGDKQALNYSSMNSQHDSDTYDDLNSLEQFENYADECDHANSYTSCAEDNIYENLEFFDNEIYHNESLSDWMRHLVHETADYEMDNIMFVKSIPSIFNVRQSRVMKRNFNRNEITMNFLRTLWNREDQHMDTMTLLLQAFSSLLRDQNKHSIYSSSATSVTKENTMEKVSSKKLTKSLKKLDNRNYQKYQCVILSVSLNSIVITYSRSQKFYFSLVCSEVFFKIPSNVRARSLVSAIKINFVFNFANKSDEIEFYKQLQKLVKFKLRERRVKVLEEIAKSNESIYQQIWTCQSNANDDDSNKRTIKSENIYASLEQIRASDDNEWEIDEEFSFKSGAYDNYFESAMNQNNNNDDDYKTVWVLYSDENPDLNKFYYDSSYMSYLNSTKDNNAESKIIQSEIQESNATTISHDIPQKYFESVDAWKVLLRSPYYMEDEEDIFINDSVLSVNFPSYYDTEDESNKSVNVSSNFSLPLDETASIKSSSHESYKSISEDALNIPEKVESPKKERERFRDKVRSKLKIRPSKASSDISSSTTVSESASFKGEDDSEKYIVFGCNLEKVEKDIEHKDIPKIIVECIKALELDHNIKVSGIYRISGNKVTIDAIKKKMNEKKPPKKESKYACLIDQDVHTLTGLLKMFFRELYTPLMARNIFIQCTSERLSTSQMREILLQMPRVNYETLKFLFKHFKTIEKYQDENLMNSGNLAICLGICLFSSNVSTPNPFDADISKCNMLCRFLIDNYYEVFESHL
ncbi:hypothetical protein PVAND_007969 [Polypedilum vanderplanki]|uniref:Rho-GAP domain-containing protein n=1 Tax=Polypedilum vanderplanki TaxID=319348 RepID=A0A9J6C890_POLVA|nr:hypothetical protein PVAND_007969 [Polypedilum vanderplanki]